MHKSNQLKVNLVRVKWDLSAWSQILCIRESLVSKVSWTGWSLGQCKHSLLFDLRLARLQCQNDQHKENQTYQTWPISGGYNSKKIIYFYFYIGLGGEVAFVIRFQKRNFTSNELKSQYDVVVENALFACSTTKEYEVSPRWHLIITEDSST